MSGTNEKQMKNVFKGQTVSRDLLAFILFHKSNPEYQTRLVLA